MAIADGRIVQETNEPELEPGISVSSESAGEPPENGPYEPTFRTESATATYVWDVMECGRIGLEVTIKADATFSIERDVCQN